MAQKESFHNQLVLNAWLLKMFQGGTFASLKERLSNPAWEGVRRNGNSEYFYQLTNFLVDEANSVPRDKLERYDLNILSYWEDITEARNRKEDSVLNLKYFQYLSLLFTEIYLDWYFNRNDELVSALNSQLEAFNQNHAESERFLPYNGDELNKIAFWNATGSGKTLLLHINIKQYLHYYQEKNGRSKWPDKIILLTPNEGLSRQHLVELDLSGMHATLFSKNSRPFPGTVEIIDVNKLGDEMKDKVIAVDAFEGNNLVMVDEGHRGTSGGGDSAAWLRRRDALCRSGFSFEYSATFGQAANKGKTITDLTSEQKKKKLLWSKGCKTQSEYKQKFPDSDFKADTDSVDLDMAEQNLTRYASPKEVYAKCILFDYSYKYFYEDGYGKESLILNLTSENEKTHSKEYLVAALLAFYQQCYLFRRETNLVHEWNIESPLWIFVGNTVTDDQSDVMTILRFLAWVTSPANRTRVETIIDEFLRDKPLLTDKNGRNVFDRRFYPVGSMSAGDVYRDIFKLVFGAEDIQLFRVVRFKGVSEELGLKVGDEPCFGVVNVGDVASVFASCENDVDIETEESEQSDSLFSSINNRDSTISVLIGSRKFTEGWSSWRVSSMGLLNMGKSEGTQIIQLFGRGVRLKGRDFSLKRSTGADRPKKSLLPFLETLNIFGIKADYISSFKDYLREEGVAIADEMLELSFNTVKKRFPAKLVTLKIKDGYKDSQKNGFKRTVSPALFDIPTEYRGKVKRLTAELDLYPKIEVLSVKDSGTTIETAKQTAVLPSTAFAFMDWGTMYLKLLEYKSQKSWFNLRLEYNKFVAFASGPADWYTLFASEDMVSFTGFKDLRRLENILYRLLCKYIERYYDALKSAYEDSFYEYTEVTIDELDCIDTYNFMVEDTSEGNEYYRRLVALKEIVEKGTIGQVSAWNGGKLEAIVFDRHIFNPLMHIEAKSDVPFIMHPLVFDAPSEVKFVKDLKALYDSPKGKKFFAGKDIYLLRNAARKSKGIGFGSGGNFYPDFLLWLVDGKKQYLTFVDPKGIHHLDLDDAKFKLHENIKEIENRLGNENVGLNVFILSETSFSDVLNKGEKTREDFEKAHILWMNDDSAPRYLEKMFNYVLNTVN